MIQRLEEVLEFNEVMNASKKDKVDIAIYIIWWYLITLVAFWQWQLNQFQGMNIKTHTLPINQIMEINQVHHIIWHTRHHSTLLHRLGQGVLQGLGLFPL